MEGSVQHPASWCCLLSVLFRWQSKLTCQLKLILVCKNPFASSYAYAVLWGVTAYAALVMPQLFILRDGWKLKFSCPAQFPDCVSPVWENKTAGFVYIYKFKSKWNKICIDVVWPSPVSELHNLHVLHDNNQCMISVSHPLNVSHPLLQCLQFQFSPVSKHVTWHSREIYLYSQPPTTLRSTTNVPNLPVTQSHRQCEVLHFSRDGIKAFEHCSFFLLFWPLLPDLLPGPSPIGLFSLVVNILAKILQLKHISFSKCDRNTQ